MRKLGLDPVADGGTEILILGTFPSEEPLSKAQYYANPDNDSWRLMGGVLDKPPATTPYDAGVQALQVHRVGLWDLYRSCRRPGRIDKDISGQRLNDFTALKAMVPSLRLVCFNGKGAGRWEERVRALGYRTLVLPTSSGANRKNQ